MLLIDDPQANASSGLGIDIENITVGTYQIVEHSNSPEEAIIKFCSKCRCYPAHIDLLP